jgi:hypothetical protein
MKFNNNDAFANLLSAVLLTVFTLITGQAVMGQNNNSSEENEAAYLNTITERSQKIVAPLNLEASKTQKICDIVKQQYRELNALYISRDSLVRLAKASNPVNNTAINSIEESTMDLVRRLHTQYIEKLIAQNLSEQQVTLIKDGMTYGVLDVTYKAYQDMVPALTAVQKVQIKAWLTEAREYAMDAESAKKKHACFRVYKGKINEYLATQGYDLKKEEKDWQARLREVRKG